MLDVNIYSLSYQKTYFYLKFSCIETEFLADETDCGGDAQTGALSMFQSSVVAVWLPESFDFNYIPGISDLFERRGRQGQEEEEGVMGHKDDAVVVSLELEAW